VRVHLLLLRLAVAALLVALAGCGGDDDGPERSAPVARAVDFPAGRGQTLAGLKRGLKEDAVLTPSVSVLEPGRRRVAFGLFDVSRKPIPPSAVAVYTAARDGRGVRGPFPARFEPIDINAPYRSRTTADDPDAATGIYVARVPFARPGERVVTALVRRGGRLVAASAHSLRVGGADPPDVGEKAIRVHTPTADEVTDIGQIDTRVPPGTMHDDDLADVLGRKPVLLLFATPQLCQSRVCGPVVDVAEQVKASHGDRVAFIHMEIYDDNRVEKGFRPQVGAWRLPSEPWAFAIDRSGRIAARLEGAFSVRELERAVLAAIG
jgi:hypothetical protein